MSEVKIVVTNIKRIENAGSLKAIVDFNINQTEFFSWRIIQQEGQSAWVSSPQESWDGKDGKKKYKPLIKLPEVLIKTVTEELIKAWNG